MTAQGPLRPPRPPRPEDAAADTPPLDLPDTDPDTEPTAEDLAPESVTAAPPGETLRRFPCSQCGAKLVFAPGRARLACPYCGHENDVPDATEEITELDFGAYLAKLAGESETEAHTTVKCDACGAEIDKPADLSALSCPFCGSAIVATEHTRRVIKPRALLPFRIESNEALARYRNWLRKLWFAPNDLKKFARLDTRLTGIYVPYWTYDSRTTTRYTGSRGEDYWVTVGSGKNRRRVRRTRWYPASGTVYNRFDDVLVLASRSLPEKQAERLEPWGLNELVPYDAAYLSGFQAENYQIDLAEGFEIARHKMLPTIRDTVRADIGGDRQRISSINVRHSDVTFKHILLPVWISAYRYRDRIYRFLVNARTGEVQGERPWSWWKIALAVLGGLVLLGGIYYLVKLAEVL